MNRYKSTKVLFYGIIISICLFIVWKKGGLHLQFKPKKFLQKQNLVFSAFPDPQSQLNSALEKARKQPYTILVWNLNQDSRNISKENCGWCEIVSDKRKINDKNTKAVVFHFRGLNQIKLPKKRRRRPGQLYIWWCRESPSSLIELHRLSLKQYDNFFNLTMTYKRNSDITTPFGSMSRILIEIRRSNISIDELLLQKSKTAIWFVSNCKSTRLARIRMEYSTKLLQAGLKLDRTGGCFNKRETEERNIIKKYKFYMAFENSYHCKDYVTEKLFRKSFLMGAVPVVYGATKSDYEAVAPPGSFIYAEDYKTPKQLVDYLNYLDNNNTAYLQYFKWRTMRAKDMPDYGRRASLCQLCRVLHGINVDNIYNENAEELASYIPMFGYPNRSRVIPSLRDWFYGSENRECLPKH